MFSPDKLQKAANDPLPGIQDNNRSHQNPLKSIMIKNEKLSKSLIYIYTGRNYNIMLNGLDLMKTKYSILL